MAARRAETTSVSKPHRSRSRSRPTSLGGGKVKSGHRLHGYKSHDHNDDNDAKSKSRRGRSKSREQRKPKRIEYDTPFDDKGRCHYHKNVQLASKKFNGGWKVLQPVCPKCMEDKFEEGSGDEKSVKSSGRSVKSYASGGTGGGEGNNAHGKYDKNGCCVIHSHIQVAKKRVLGSGWKVS